MKECERRSYYSRIQIRFFSVAKDGLNMQTTTTTMQRLGLRLGIPGMEKRIESTTHDWALKDEGTE